MKFRNADFDSPFKKYEIVRINGTYHQTKDNRPESFRPRQDEMIHIERLDSGKNWVRRRAGLESLIGETTMCDLLAQNPKGGMATASPSLGLITPSGPKEPDWEVGQAGRRWKAEYGDTGTREAMMKRWRDDMLAPGNDIHFYVGNQNRLPP